MNFEDKLQQFYSGMTLRGRTVIDVGANVGRHAIPLAELVGIEGTVHAFEPLPSVRSALVANLLAAGHNNVVVYPFALAAERTTADFNFIPNLPEESGLKKRRVYNGVPSEFQVLRVSVFRLDDLIPSSSRVDFIKIDVEGGELDTLSGAASLMRISRPVVAFECGASSYLGYHETPERIFSMFDELGYQIYAITGVQMTDTKAFAEATSLQVFWDYIALPMEQKSLAALLSR